MALTLWMQMKSAQSLRGSNRPTCSSLKDGWKPSFKTCLSETAAGEYGCLYTNTTLFALFAAVLKVFKKKRRSCCNNCANLNGPSRWVSSLPRTHLPIQSLSMKKDSRIIFLCQGLGGVMIKQVSWVRKLECCCSQDEQALVHASAERDYSEIKHATWVLLLILEWRTFEANGKRSGLVFFGTPHKKINQGRTGLFETIFSNLFRSDAREKLPRLQIDLELLSTAFRHQVEDYKFVSFYSETDQVRNGLSGQIL